VTPQKPSWRSRADLDGPPQGPAQQRLLAHLEQLARPRHAQWDRLGLMSVRTTIHEQLAALGPVQEHPFQEGNDAGTNLILRLPGQNPKLDPLLVCAHYPLPSPRLDSASFAGFALASPSFPIVLHDHTKAGIRWRVSIHPELSAEDRVVMRCLTPADAASCLNTSAVPARNQGQNLTTACSSLLALVQLILQRHQRRMNRRPFLEHGVAFR